MQCTLRHRDLHPFPTRRSSDLEYPPSKEKPAYRHDDLMVIYRDSPSRQFRAIYFDSEEHTIEYSIKPVDGDRKSTRLNSSHITTSYAVFCLKKKTIRPGMQR